MADRILLIDTDMFILLSCANVLDGVIEMLGFTAPQTRRLPALESQLQRGKHFRQTYGALCDTALNYCRRVPILTEPARDIDALSRLARVDDIDEGEAQLYALLCHQQHYLLASGDKRAMISLATTPGIRDIRNAVVGRVVCLETAIRLLVQADGIVLTAAAFTPLREVHTTLRVVFSQGDATPVDHCRTALDSYERDLIRQVGEDFLYRP